MYGNVIISLAVILMLELLPTSAWAARLRWSWAVGLTAGAAVTYLLCVRMAFLLWHSKKASALDSDTFRIFHSSLMQRFVIGGLVLYGFVLYWLGWKGLWGGLLVSRSDALANLLGILPFLLILMGVWAACFPGPRRAGSTMGPYLWIQARLYLPVLIPWFGILSFMDLLAIVAPKLEQKVQEDVLWGLGAFALLLMVLAWAFPSLVIRLWRCPPMPPGAARAELEEFFHRHGFRYRGIFLWTLLKGAISTAGIIGVFPRARYILITPSLLRILDEQELLAVMAHEMGHVRHHHMAFYLAFMVGLTVLVDLCLRAVPWVIGVGLLTLEAVGIPVGGWSAVGGMDPSSLSLAAFLLFLGLVLVYLRFGFGLFSRNFERQADLHALELQGSVLPLVRSLEKIGGFHPLVRSLPSWHHYSIQERIAFLLSCERSPATARRHHRKVRTMVGGYLSVLLALVVLLVGWRSMDWEKHWSLALQGYLASKMVHREPANPNLWFLLGTLALEKGDLASSEEALLRSLELDPGNPEALNNLAWLYATAGEPRFRDPEKALRLALAAAQLRPNEPHILDTLAEACFINGRIQEAVELEQRALAGAKDRMEHYRRQLERFQKALSERP